MGSVSISKDGDKEYYRYGFVTLGIRDRPRDGYKNTFSVDLSISNDADKEIPWYEDISICTYDESDDCRNTKEKKDFFVENGLIVFTEAYHLKRGYCCGSGCRFCPYTPKHKKGNTVRKEI